MCICIYSIHIRTWWISKMLIIFCYFSCNTFHIRKNLNRKAATWISWFDFLRRFIKRIYVVSIYTSCGGIANSFFPWHDADPFKNVTHWVLGSASPVIAITYCRSQEDSLLVYCLWTTRLQHDERTIAKCLLFAMSWFGTRCMAHDEITPLDWKQISIFRQITIADDSFGR